MNSPKVILAADLGIRLDTLSNEERYELEQELTAESIPWKDNPSVVVRGAYERDGYLWIPRQFALERGYKPDLDLRSEGNSQSLEFRAKLDPDRDQPRAVSEMVKYIRKNGSGILIAPTGNGKTVQGYAIGSQFNTSIGVIVYAGHMITNWREQAKQTFGITDNDIGIVQQDSADIGKPITIFSIQSLLVRDYPREVYDQIGFIIADETNHHAALEFSKAVRLFKAKYRLSTSAEVNRADGLENVIYWNYGNVGYEIKKKIVPLTIHKIQLNIDYPQNSYKDWWSSRQKETFIGDPLRYDKKLASDPARNKILVGLILDARKQERRILIFSRLRDHLDYLKAETEKEYIVRRQNDFPETIFGLLVGGRTTKKAKAENEEAMKADVIFSTYKYASDALNITTIDTEFFATPPGNPLQPAGRLRDKGAKDRKPLLLVDFHELNQFSIRKWKRRKSVYMDLGYTVQDFSKKIS